MKMWTMSMSMSVLLALAITGSVDAQTPPSPSPPMTGKAEGAVVKVRGTVSAVDKENKTITLKGPRGRTLTFDVQDPTKLETVKVGDPVVCIHGDGSKEVSKVTMLFHFHGMLRIEINEALAGDIIGLTGLSDVFIGETITDCEERQALRLRQNAAPESAGGQYGGHANDRHAWWGFSLGLPATVTSVDGITVRADVAQSNNGGNSNLCVELSWDGGTSWTAAKSLAMTSNGTTTYEFGGATDKWSHTAWTLAQLGGSTFRVRITDATDQNNKDYLLDWLRVSVAYTP